MILLGNKQNSLILLGLFSFSRMEIPVYNLGECTPWEDCVDSLIKEAVKKEFIQRTKTVWKSLLSAKNKVRAYNSVCVGLFTYCFGLIKWTKSELENLDKDVRKIMTMNKNFSKHSDVDRLFLQRKNGGRGLVCIKDFCDRMCVSTVGYIMKATTAQGKAI